MPSRAMIIQAYRCLAAAGWYYMSMFEPLNPLVTLDRLLHVDVPLRDELWKSTVDKILRTSQIFSEKTSILKDDATGHTFITLDTSQAGSRLETLEPKRFLQEIAYDLVRKGHGVAVSGSDKKLTKVLTCGDLLTLLQTGNFEFFVPGQIHGELRNNPYGAGYESTLQRQLTSMVPDTFLLPNEVRPFIRDRLKNLGVKNPGVCKVLDPLKDPVEAILFNLPVAWSAERQIQANNECLFYLRNGLKAFRPQPNVAYNFTPL